MKEYEIIFLVKPNLADERYKELAEKFKAVVTDNGGEIRSEQMMGMRELPQELSKQKKAYYVYIEFNADSKVNEKIKHFMAVTEDIFRHLIVLSESVRRYPRKAKVVKVEATSEA
jgi:small subunit ribosomal protein S6